MKSPRQFILVLVIFAFLLRIAAVFALRDFREGPSERLGADGIEFNLLGRGLAAGHGYVSASGKPTSFRAPGFPFLLAALHFISPGGYPWFYIVFGALGALSCGLGYLLARELMPELEARAAGVLIAVYPPHIYFSTEFASETLFVPLLTFGLWRFVRCLSTRSRADAAAAGLALGFAILTRPFALLILPAWIAVWLWRKRPDRLPASAAVILVAGCLAVVLPWTARNASVHHAFVLVAGNGGSTFYGSNNDWAVSEAGHWGLWVTPRLLPGAAEDLPQPEIQRDRLEWSRGVQWVRTHLRAMPLLLAAKYARLWMPDISSPNRKYVLLQLVSTTPFLLLMLAGQILMLRAARWWTPAWIAVHATGAMTAVTAFLFWGSPRFRDANAALLMLYIVPVFERLLARRARATAARAVARATP